MNLRTYPVLAGVALAIASAFVAAPARAADATPAPASSASPASAAPAAPAAAAAKPAEDFLSRISVNIAPGYFFASNGDAAPAPLADRTAHIFYDTRRRNADILRFDYGASFKIDAKTSLAFSHGNVAYQLGRILLPGNAELSSGEIVDYTDTYALNRTIGGGVGVHVTYFNHQRSSGPQGTNPFLCLNQKVCNDPVTGAKFNNPNSIDEHGYTFGGTYDFGPTSKIGKILTAAVDLKYVPRPDTPNNIPARAGTVPTALGDLGAYKGSQVLFPYSLTLKLPITNSSTFIPFVNYTNLPVLYRDSAVPEAYRGWVYGIVKVVDKNITVSYVNLNLQSCRCITRVPPPDNLRLAFGILKIDFHTQL